MNFVHRNVLPFAGRTVVLTLPTFFSALIVCLFAAIAVAASAKEVT